MSVELIRDLFKVDQVVGQSMAQTIVEGDILVPDTKPDITRVLSANGKVHLIKQEIIDNKINVEGTTYFKILYVSEKGDQPLYSIDSSADFKQSIVIEGIDTHMKPSVSVDVEHIDFTMSNDRKVGVKAVITMNGKSIEERSLDVTNGISGLTDIQVLKDRIEYTDIVGISKSETLVKDGFEMTEEDYGIREILRWDVTAVEKESKITDGRVIVSGVVNVNLLYVDDEYDNRIKSMTREIPFTHFVEISEAYSDMKYTIKLSANDFYYYIKENIRGERKIVEMESVINVEAKVIDTQSMEILLDTYVPGKPLSIHKKKIELKENIGISKFNVLIRETIDSPYTHPPIAEILVVDAKPILTDYNAMYDKVSIEGILETNIIYKSTDEEYSLYSFLQEVPFRQVIDVNGLRDGMEVDVDIFIEGISYNILNGEQVEIKVNIGTLCEAYGSKIIDVIDSIEELDMSDDVVKRHSLTVYFMNEGDTLWSIAKRYNTTVEKIMETNQIQDPLSMKNGDNIIIEKVHNLKF